jgi:hypothetical protein
VSALIESAAEAERQANQLREDLTATLDQLRGNLKPSRLAKEALATTRSHTPDWLADTLTFVKSPSGLALVAAATAAVTVTLRRGRR